MRKYIVIISMCLFPNTTLAMWICQMACAIWWCCSGCNTLQNFGLYSNFEAYCGSYDRSFLSHLFVSWSWSQSPLFDLKSHSCFYFYIESVIFGHVGYRLSCKGRFVLIQAEIFMRMGCPHHIDMFLRKPLLQQDENENINHHHKKVSCFLDQVTTADTKMLISWSILVQLLLSQPCSIAKC